MKRFSTLFMAGVLLAVLSLLALPVIAQDDEGGTGGIIVESNIGDDPSTFNPIISSDTSSSAVHQWMYPGIIALDDELLIEEPMAPGGLARDWEYDETGTELTVYLREDLTWGDGTPITADDYIWALDAVKSGQTSSVRTYVFYELDDGTQTDGVLFDYEKIDDYTIQFTLGSPELDENGEWTGNVLPNCVALSDLNDIAVVPSHLFEPIFGDNYALMDDDPYFVPRTDDGTAATWGVFTDPFMEFGVQVSLLADQNYDDTQLGYVSPGEWIYLQVEDQTVAYEKFLAGDFTTLGIPANNQNDFREIADDQGFQYLEYPANGYTYVGWNLADPTNPQDGRDADGNIVDQGIHPVFGDTLVRQAMAYAIDVQSMIGSRPDPETGDPATGILEGNGYPVTTHNHPGLSWVDPQLEPYAYDPALALEMLAEAGWEDSDGDGLLECNDCLYAREVDPEFNGTPMTFELLTNSGNVIRESVGETMKTQLEELGITVDFQAIEWGSLLDALDAQTFDAIIIGWSLGLPFDPDGRWAFGIGADRVGGGFNAGSYYSPELEALWEQAVSVPGCAQEDRIELYREAMGILYEDQPYLFLFAGNVMVAAQPEVENFDPLPYNSQWNIDSWTVGE